MNSSARRLWVLFRGIFHSLFVRTRYVIPQFLLFLAAVGCGFPERPKVITISKAPVFRPSGPKEIKTLEEVMSTIITACRDDLGLPVVDPLEVHLYKNRTSFATYGFGWRTMPTDVRHVAAFANKNELHINLETPVTMPWGYWLELLAHEYGHNIHYTGTKDFHGNLHDSPRWVVEGFGQWVAARVLHSMKWQDYDVSVHRASSELLRHRDKLPQLSWLNDSRNWEGLANRPYAGIRTYQLAFIAVHQMLHGQQISNAVERLVTGKYGTIDSQTKLDAYLSQLSSPNHTHFSMPKPEWKIGHRWSYRSRIPGLVSDVEREVLSETNFDGHRSFVVKVGSEKNVYPKDSLGVLATFKGDKLVSRRNRPNQIFSWPLEAGKEWRNVYKVENLEEHMVGEIDRVMVISGLEKIVVPAGSFDSVKIDAYDYQTGRLEAEYWYSPETRSVIKFRSYGGDAWFTEEELVSFKVH
jgi:hypothetical protein